MKRAISLGLLCLLILWANPSFSKTRAPIFCAPVGMEPYIIQKGKVITGIDIEIIVQALKNEKIPAQINAMKWPQLLNALETGSCDFGFALFDKEDRRKFVEYLFTVPLHYSTFSAFVKKGQEFQATNVTAFLGKTIGHLKGFSLTVGFEQAIADQKIKRLQFVTAEEAFMLLKSGKVDVILGNNARFRHFLRSQKKKQPIKALNIPFLPHQPAFLVVSRQSKLNEKTQLRDKLEKQLRQMHLSGTILRITSGYLH